MKRRDETDVRPEPDKEKKFWYGVGYLLPYLKEHQKYFILIFVAMVLVAATSALSAYIFKHILNDIFIAKDEVMLWVLPLIVITLFLVRGLARFFSSYLTTYIGISIASTLRKRLFGHLLSVQYTTIEKITSGDINALIIQTVLNIQNCISKTIPQLIISALTVVALVIVIFYTDWHLALYAMVVGVLIVLPIQILGKKVKKHTGGSETMVIQMANRVNEAFGNLDIVKVYGQEKYEQTLFANFLKGYEKFQIKLAKYQLLSSPFMEFVVALAIAIVIYVGGHSVVKGEMTAGDFFAFLVALTMLYAPIKNLTQNIMALYMLNGYVDRVEDILAIPLENNSADMALASIESVAFEHIDYSIDTTQILQNVSFEIHKGDRIAIVGKSGAGKSSIISLLFGLAKASSGNIMINGAPHREYAPQAIRRQVSYVNQNAGVFNATIQENILYGEHMDKDRYELAKTEAQCGFIDQLPQADQTIAGEFGNRLSGGQRQRIALARAIYKGGSLFVLDEATSALDANTESMLQQSLERTMREKTSIIIAHRLATIEMCNKVIVLEAGRVVAYGKYDEVSKSEAFRRNFMMDGGA